MWFAADRTAPFVISSTGIARLSYSSTLFYNSATTHAVIAFEKRYMWRDRSVVELSGEELGAEADRLQAEAI